MPPKLPALDAPLTDGAVALRGWQRSDAETLSALFTDPDVGRWTPIEQPFTGADAARWIAERERGRVEGGSVAFAATEAGDGRVVGSLQLFVHDWQHRRAEVAYVVAAAERGGGFATAGVVLLSRWALDELRLARLEILAEPDNHASQRVAARAGFTREGILRAYRDMKGERIDLVVHSLLPGDLGATVPPA